MSAALSLESVARPLKLKTGSQERHRKYLNLAQLPGMQNSCTHMHSCAGGLKQQPLSKTTGGMQLQASDIAAARDAECCQLLSFNSTVIMTPLVS
jgi:hypothetical protein